MFTLYDYSILQWTGTRVEGDSLEHSTQEEKSLFLVAELLSYFVTPSFILHISITFIYLSPPVRTQSGLHCFPFLHFMLTATP